MKALVVYESMFGNTKQVAQAIARGLEKSAEVELVEVSDAPPNPDVDVDLIVAGGPTHAFSMSRASTRGNAIDRGATEGEQGIGLREWIEALPKGRHADKIATFDTRVRTMRHLPGSAAKGAAKAARHHRYESAAPAESFYVDDIEGPLLGGELDRAEAWGKQLGTSLAGPRASDA